MGVAHYAVVSMFPPSAVIHTKSSLCVQREYTRDALVPHTCRCMGDLPILPARPTSRSPDTSPLNPENLDNSVTIELWVVGQTGSRQPLPGETPATVEHSAWNLESPEKLCTGE